MIGRALALAIVSGVGFALYYVSRFYDLRLWGREGLFGIDALRPQGNLVQSWVRGTDLAPFDLLIWAIGAILVLTGLQKLFDLFRKR